MDTILGLALAASMVTKTIVDLLKVAADVPRWTPPAVALAVGVGTVFLLMLSDGTAMTSAAIASAVLAGCLSAGAAIGVTELGRRADTVTTERRAAPR